MGYIINKIYCILKTKYSRKGLALFFIKKKLIFEMGRERHVLYLRNASY